AAARARLRLGVLRGDRSERADGLAAVSELQSDAGAEVARAVPRRAERGRGEGGDRPGARVRPDRPAQAAGGALLIRRAVRGAAAREHGVAVDGGRAAGAGRAGCAGRAGRSRGATATRGAGGAGGAGGAAATRGA